MGDNIRILYTTWTFSQWRYYCNFWIAARYTGTIKMYNKHITYILYTSAAVRIAGEIFVPVDVMLIRKEFF